MAEYDQGYKLLFSHPEMVEDLLRGFICEDWIHALDFSSLERMNPENISDDLRARQDDLIWRVRFADNWLYVYLLLEFQSSVDRFMAVRLMTYVGLLYQDLVRTNQLTAAGKLPPVLPVVLYNGEPRWRAPVEILDLIEKVPGSLARHSPRFRYCLIDEGAYGQEALASVKNLVSLLFRLETTASAEVSRELLMELVRWLKEKPELQRAFAVFINRIYFKSKVDVERLYLEAKDDEEVTDMLSKNVERWIEEYKAQGEALGRAQGEALGRAHVAEKLLLKGMPTDQVAEVTGLSSAEIETLRSKLQH